MAEQLRTIRVFPEELKLLGEILKRGGWTVYSPEDSMTIVDLLQQISTQPATESVPPSATEISTQVIHDLPTPPDVSAALASIQQSVNSANTAIANGQAVDKEDLQKIQTSVDQVNATLGVISPTPPAP